MKLKITCGPRAFAARGAASTVSLLWRSAFSPVSFSACTGRGWAPSWAAARRWPSPRWPRQGWQFRWRPAGPASRWGTSRRNRKQRSPPIGARSLCHVICFQRRTPPFCSRSRLRRWRLGRQQWRRRAQSWRRSWRRRRSVCRRSRCSWWWAAARICPSGCRTASVTSWAGGAGQPSKPPVNHVTPQASWADRKRKCVRENGKRSTRNLSRVMRQIKRADTSLEISDKIPATLQATLFLQAMSSNRYLPRYSRSATPTTAR